MNNTKAYFNGFSPKAIVFLMGLKKNNKKEWFDAHKKEYQDELLTPLRALVADLSGFMLTIDPHFEVRPAVNKTISRIYRDIRFSRDKSPYKTSMWITFKRSNKEWQDFPAYYFEISPDSYRYGMGFYCVSKVKMDRFRKLIDEKPQQFSKAIEFYKKQDIFTLAGEKYKRILDKSKTPDILEWYQRKSFYLTCEKEIGPEIFSRTLIDELRSAYSVVAPFYQFLWGI